MRQAEGSWCSQTQAHDSYSKQIVHTHTCIHIHTLLSMTCTIIWPKCVSLSLSLPLSTNLSVSTGIKLVQIRSDPQRDREGQTKRKREKERATMIMTEEKCLSLKLFCLSHIILKVSFYCFYKIN